VRSTEKEWNLVFLLFLLLHEVGHKVDLALVLSTPCRDAEEHGPRQKRGRHHVLEDAGVHEGKLLADRNVVPRASDGVSKA
jgi:hypothetical protein